MALDTYPHLIAALQTLADTDFDFVDAVRLAEIQAQLDLRLRMTEKSVTGTFTANQDYINLPGDCIQVRHLRIDTDPIRGVDIVAPQAFDFIRQNFPGSHPMVAMADGLTLKIAPTPGTDPYTLFYDGGIPALTNDAPTNFLLTTYPNVLLYGSLVQYAIGWLGNDERAIGWGQLYSAALRPAKMREAASKLGGGPLQMRPDVWA